MERGPWAENLKIILASQSPARRRLLKRVGVKFSVQSPRVDEDAFKVKIRKADRLVATLAREKAREVFLRFPQTVVIGSDQMVVRGSKLLGKPKTFSGAVAQLTECSGKTIRLLTAVCVVSSGTEHVHVDVTRMKFRQLGREEIEAYVKADQPFECAGSFMFEKRGLSLFESVETQDPSAIEGLPVMMTLSLVQKTFLQVHGVRSAGPVKLT